MVFDGLSDSLSSITEDFKALVNKEVLKIVGPLLKQKEKESHIINMLVYLRMSKYF